MKILILDVQGTGSLLNVNTYGSVSAGREFWPFRVIFFQKVERSCGQTVKDRFDFSIDSGQLYLVHSGDLNLALDNKEEEEEGGNNDEEKEEDKTNNKKEMLRIWMFFWFHLLGDGGDLHGTPKKFPRPG